MTYEILSFEMLFFVKRFAHAHFPNNNLTKHIKKLFSWISGVRQVFLTLPLLSFCPYYRRKLLLNSPLNCRDLSARLPLHEYDSLQINLASQGESLAVTRGKVKVKVA